MTEEKLKSIIDSSALEAIKTLTKNKPMTLAKRKPLTLVEKLLSFFRVKFFNEHTNEYTAICLVVVKGKKYEVQDFEFFARAFAPDHIAMIKPYWKESATSFRRLFLKNDESVYIVIKIFGEKGIEYIIEREKE